MFLFKHKNYVVDIKAELSKKGYKIFEIIAEDEKSIVFREYSNCCSNEFMRASLKGKVINIYNSKDEKVDEIKV